MLLICFKGCCSYFSAWGQDGDLKTDPGAGSACPPRDSAESSANLWLLCAPARCCVRCCSRQLTGLSSHQGSLQSETQYTQHHTNKKNNSVVRYGCLCVVMHREVRLAGVCVCVCVYGDHSYTQIKPHLLLTVWHKFKPLQMHHLFFLRGILNKHSQNKQKTVQDATIYSTR